MLCSFQGGLVFPFLSAACGSMIYRRTGNDSTAFQCHNCPPTPCLFILLFGFVLYLRLLFFPLGVNQAPVLKDPVAANYSHLLLIFCSTV